VEARVTFRREGDWIVGVFEGVDGHGRPLHGEGRVNTREMLHPGAAAALMHPDALAAAGFSFSDLNPVHLVKSAAHAVSSAAKDVAHTVSKAVKAVEKIPVLGTALHATLAVTPFKLAADIASGARLDHALMAHFKDQLAVIHEVAPYAVTIVSFVPGIGTGVAAAVAAGAALAEGKSITAALEAGVRGAIPGGPLVQAGFDIAMKAAQGQNIGKAALEAARNQLPPAAQKAFDIGLAVATGKSLQAALANAVTSLLPGQLQSILDAGKAALAKTPGLSQLAGKLTDAAGHSGLTLAAGLLAHKGINAGALSAVRAKLQGSALAGFDAAIASQVPHQPWLKAVSTAAPIAAAAKSVMNSAAQTAHASAAASLVAQHAKAAQDAKNMEGLKRAFTAMKAAQKPAAKPAPHVAAHKPAMHAAARPPAKPAPRVAAHRPAMLPAARRVAAPPTHPLAPVVPEPNRPPIDVRAKSAFEAANTLLEAAEQTDAGRATLDGHLSDLAKRSTTSDIDGEKARRMLKILGIVRDWRTGLRAAQDDNTAAAASVHGMTGGLDLPPTPIPDPSRLIAAGVPPGSF
jgi:hypothetical protein